MQEWGSSNAQQEQMHRDTHTDEASYSQQSLILSLLDNKSS